MKTISQSTSRLTYMSNETRLTCNDIDQKHCVTINTLRNLKWQGAGSQSTSQYSRSFFIWREWDHEEKHSSILYKGSPLGKQASPKIQQERDLKVLWIPMLLRILPLTGRAFWAQTGQNLQIVVKSITTSVAWSERIKVWMAALQYEHLYYTEKESIQQQKYRYRYSWSVSHLYWCLVIAISDSSTAIFYMDCLFVQ